MSRCTRAGRPPVHGAVRIPVERPVRAVTGPGHRALLPARTPARRAGENRSLLFDVRTEVLFDAHQPGRPRRDGPEVARVRGARQPGVSARHVVTVLPLAPPGETPRRVLTIAGSDSGGGAGLQADVRTCALLGVHALVAVTAVTVQNSLGVKAFHEIPVDVIAGQIEAVASDIGVQAAKTGMLASSAIIEAVAETWRSQGLTGAVPLVVDPVCASMHGDPLLRPDALDSLRSQLFPLATLVTPNLHEVRLLVEIDVVDTDSQREAARALHALGPQWVLVKGGHLRSSAQSPDLLFDGSDFHEFD